MSYFSVMRWIDAHDYCLGRSIPALRRTDSTLTWSAPSQQREASCGEGPRHVCRQHEAFELEVRELDVQKTIFSSDNLPSDLNDKARFNLWRDIYAATIGSLEFGTSEHSPFQATIEALPIGAISYAKTVGTVNHVIRTPQNLRANTHDSYSLIITEAAACGHLSWQRTRSSRRGLLSRRGRAAPVPANAPG
ncbi:hypothetical protein [Rhizobium mulingense]|uniref:hypothetical protein n=1 Tax=Rhizobium mulingense TaxID=3031128 RepID=UPI002B48C833|nr:hypothetical protein [Rhizobium sp. MJ21]MEB3042208.1 hypothetical protein [Rhizobium sp. MJ21]